MDKSKMEINNKIKLYRCHKCNKKFNEKFHYDNHMAKNRCLELLTLSTDIINDIDCDTDSKPYLDLKVKLKDYKKNGKSLLIKINSHPCSGKST